MHCKHDNTAPRYRLIGAHGCSAVQKLLQQTTCPSAAVLCRARKNSIMVSTLASCLKTARCSSDPNLHPHDICNAREDSAPSGPHRRLNIPMVRVRWCSTYSSCGMTRNYNPKFRSHIEKTDSHSQFLAMDKASQLNLHRYRLLFAPPLFYCDSGN